MNVKLFLTFCWLVFSLNSQKHTAIKNDIVESSNIYLANSSKRIYSLGPPPQLQNAFGKANIEKLNDEVLDGVSYNYKYNGLEIYFNKNSFEAITLNKPDYKMYLDGVWIRVGENIEKLKKYFPNSYASRGINNKPNGFYLTMQYHNKPVDAYVTISYNTKGNITQIWLGNDNS